MLKGYKYSGNTISIDDTFFNYIQIKSNTTHHRHSNTVDHSPGQLVNNMIGSTKTRHIKKPTIEIVRRYLRQAYGIELGPQEVVKSVRNNSDTSKLVLAKRVDSNYPLYEIVYTKNPCIIVLIKHSFDEANINVICTYYILIPTNQSINEIKSFLGDDKVDLRLYYSPWDRLCNSYGSLLAYITN